MKTTTTGRTIKGLIGARWLAVLLAGAALAGCATDG